MSEKLSTLEPQLSISEFLSNGLTRSERPCMIEAIPMNELLNSLRLPARQLALIAFNLSN